VVKINFDQLLLTLEGKPIMHPDPNATVVPGKKRPTIALKLKDVCVNALLQVQPQDNVSGKEKLERWENAKVIQKGGTISFTEDYLDKLKNLVNEAYPSPVVVGQVWEMLSRGTTEEEKVKT